MFLLFQWISDRYLSYVSSGYCVVDEPIYILPARLEKIHKRSKGNVSCVDFRLLEESFAFIRSRVTLSLYSNPIATCPWSIGGYSTCLWPVESLLMIYEQILNNLRTAYDRKAAERDQYEASEWKQQERQRFLSLLRQDGPDTRFTVIGRWPLNPPP